MEYRDSLLFSSLIQISKISPEQEALYWKQNIFTLDDLANNLEEQLSFFSVSQFEEIQKLIDDGGTNINTITEIFEKKTGKKDLYRIAYSIPENVMFLDIETTGLSPIYHYITIIGWMINGQYGYWIAGTDPSDFLAAYQEAKMLITFNGVRFDCKFLDAFFPDLKIKTKPNLDLMTFCRGFDLKEGQKNIEKELKFKRPENVVSCDGKEAIALWYKFIFGEDDALRTLITYNYYDILGMAYILDKVFFKKIYGKKFPHIGKPRKFYNPSNFCLIDICIETRNAIRDYINSKNFNLHLLKASASKRIVGIDLAGVIKKSSHTGICLLVGNKASTKTVMYNDEIIKYVEEVKADIVSIDAPLSLPNGRTSVYDDDPMFKDAGIMRYCERELHKRGVNSYPALIKSMQELTKRGIYLSQQLRKMGYPVIECFPGAAQDILQLPRKRTDVNLLKTGLIRLGIQGDFENRKIIHDELDAITAAIVGQFFIDNFYEPIGIPEENDMIVPSQTKIIPSFQTIIGITGHISAGKTTVARYIEQRGFTYCRYSQIIAEILKNKHVDVNRSSLQQQGDQMFGSSSQYELNKQVDHHLSDNPLIVIDGMRHYEDYTYWKEKNYTRFFLLYIDALEKICISRYDEGDYLEASRHHVESEIDGLKSYADYVIENNTSLEELFIQIDDILEAID